jgi:hypothetical protein
MGYEPKRITVEHASTCLTCKRPVPKGVEANWLPGLGVWHTTCEQPSRSFLGRLRVITKERLSAAPPHVRARLAAKARIGLVLIGGGLILDVALAALVLAKAPTAQWLLTLVLLGPGVLVMMIGAHLISQKFTTALADVVRAVRDKAG